MKRIISILIIFSLVMGVIGGCRGKEENAKKQENTSGVVETKTTKEEKGTDKKVQRLDFVWFSDGVEGDVTKEIIKEYQAKNSHININMIEVPYKDLETKLKVMISGGEPPALSRLTQLGAFKDTLVDLSQYIKDSDKFIDQFSDSLQSFYILDGKVIAAPIDTTANGIIYNKTAFDKAGISVPASPDNIWTWDEWADALKQVMEKGGVRYGMVFDKTPHRFSTLIYQAGGRMLSEDGKKVVINSPEVVETVNFFVKLHQEGIIPDSVWLGSENPNNLFRTGQVGMHFSGSWMLTNYRDNVEGFEWGVTYMPKGKIRSSVPGGKYIGAFQNSGVEEGAVDFIQYFTSKEVNAKYAKESLFISPRKDNANLDYDFGKDMFAIFANELLVTPGAAAQDWADPILIPAIQNELRDGIVEVMAGRMTAEEMLNDVAAKGQEAIDK